MTEFIIKLLVISFLLKIISNTILGVTVGNFTNIIGIASLITILGSLGVYVGYFIWYASFGFFRNFGGSGLLGMASLHFVHFLVMLICSALVLNWFNKPGSSLEIKNDYKGLMVCLILSIGTTLVQGLIFYFGHYNWLEFWV